MCSLTPLGMDVKSGPNCLGMCTLSCIETAASAPITVIETPHWQTLDLNACVSEIALALKGPYELSK